MKIIKTEDKEWQQKTGYSKRIFVTGKDVSQPGLLVQELRVRPGETAKAHYHKEQTEIFYFLNDNGYFIVNGEKIPVTLGMILIIKPNDAHEVVNDSDKDFLYLAFKVKYAENDSFWE